MQAFTKQQETIKQNKAEMQQLCIELEKINILKDENLQLKDNLVQEQTTRLKCKREANELNNAKIQIELEIKEIKQQMEAQKAHFDEMEEKYKAQVQEKVEKLTQQQ